MNKDRADAMQSPRVFVSFSNADKDFVRRFIARITEQPLRVWIYEDEADEIRTGQRIADRLHQQIDASQFVIPIVSTEALRSRYTQMEVAYALQRCKAGQLRGVLPIVSHELAARNESWTGSYRDLQTLRYRVIDFQSLASIEAAIHPLCTEFCVEYQPLVPQDPRLPFMDRFVAEVRDRCPQREEYEIGIYRRLMAILNQFSVTYESGDYDRAGQIMHYFCLMCEHEFPDQSVYYPRVVKGVCEIIADRTSDALQTFNALLLHPSHDECTYGALGWICQHQGDYVTALEHYREALRRYPSDPAARTGVAINAVMCGQVADVDVVLRDIDPAAIPFEEDRIKVQSVQAFALAHLGRWAEAAELFTYLIDRQQADVATVTRFAQLLAEQGQFLSAVSILERFKDDIRDPVLLHHLAMYTALGGDLRKSQRYFTDLVQCCPQKRQYRVEFAQIHWRVGNRGESRRQAATLFDRGLFDLPAMPADFYLDGFANWILGNNARAEYDFERSGYSTDQHYRQLLPL